MQEGFAALLSTARLRQGAALKLKEAKQNKTKK